MKKTVAFVVCLLVAMTLYAGVVRHTTTTMTKNHLFWKEQ